MPKVLWYTLRTRNTKHKIHWQAEIDRCQCIRPKPLPHQNPVHENIDIAAQYGQHAGNPSFSICIF